jgi:chorismate dehydratase
MKKIRVSAVSYLNTKPFIYGLKNSVLDKEVDLKLDFPSKCAEKLANNEADIGLIPTAVIPEIPNAEIISKYCIGSTGNVRTVIIASEVPINQIETIILDSHSKTSVLLARILASQYWKISPKWVPGEIAFEKNKIKETTAGVVIGDKVFGVENKYRYIYDLSAEWRNFTDSDFVFACWTANKPISEEFKEKFDKALKHGVNSISKIIAENEQLYPDYNLNGYFKDNISFFLDERKKKGLNLFWEQIKNGEY